MGARVHVVGAGLSGLAAAVALALAGQRLTLYEAAGQAGGRCRSFFEPALGCRIDNGNHLLLSGNRSVLAYLAAIGAADRLVGPDRAEFPFVDLATGERWTVRPGAGPVPWWIFAPSRRVPGSGVADYGRALTLAFAGRGATVANCFGDAGSAFRRFWEPLTVAVLNTEASAAAARLLWPVVRETFGRGEAACRPRMAKEGLSETFVEPALATLASRGATVRLHARVHHLEPAAERIARLHLADGEAVTVGPGDVVILAVPAAAAARLLPGLTTPEDHRPIVNAHFRLPHRLADWRLVGIIGGLSQWVFVRGEVASVTVSAATEIAEEPAPPLLQRMWAEVRRVLDLAGPAEVPPARLIKEKRATFAQTPSELARRPPCRTGLAGNLLLAGDWTDTGLPATLEGSVRSGHTAARHALTMLAKS